MFDDVTIGLRIYLIGNSHFPRSRNFGSHDDRTINDIVRNAYIL